MPKLEKLVKNIIEINTKRKVHLTLSNSIYVKLMHAADISKVSMSKIVEQLIQEMKV